MCRPSLLIVAVARWELKSKLYVLVGGYVFFGRLLVVVFGTLAPVGSFQVELSTQSRVFQNSRTALRLTSTQVYDIYQGVKVVAVARKIQGENSLDCNRFQRPVP